MCLSRPLRAHKTSELRGCLYDLADQDSCGSHKSRLQTCISCFCRKLCMVFSALKIRSNLARLAGNGSFPTIAASLLLNLPCNHAPIKSRLEAPHVVDSVSCIFSRGRGRGGPSMSPNLFYVLHPLCLQERISYTAYVHPLYEQHCPVQPQRASDTIRESRQTNSALTCPAAKS